MSSENTAMQSISEVHCNAISLIIMELKSSNSKASDRVQSKRPIETPGFLISLIIIARLAF